MKGLMIFVVGICVGISAQRVGGDYIDGLISKTLAGVEAFQSENGK